jgi:hypothetical protein
MVFGWRRKGGGEMRESKFRLAQRAGECNEKLRAYRRACFIWMIRTGMGIHSRDAFGVTKTTLMSSESGPGLGLFLAISMALATA